MKPKVSIIIPVYNVGKHLEKCLVSVLNQTLKEIEVIAINDGSTDESLRILNQFSKVDSRLLIINQENQGVSAARNKGLSLAQGEYIGFVDSDDYIELTMYEKLYKYAKMNDSDIVVSNVYDEDMKSQKISLSLETQHIEIDHCRMDKFLENNFYRIGHAVWHKIFRRSLIVENEIEFFSYQEVSSEDMLFNLFALSCAKTIDYLNEPLYHYVIHEKSLTKSSQARTNMLDRSKRTVELVQNQYNLRNIEISKFLGYLTYSELIRALSYSPKKISFLSKHIKEYSRLNCFNSALKQVIQGTQLKRYFINERDNYSKVFEYFDRVFALLCLYRLYYLASGLHYFRLKRAVRLKAEV